MERLYQAARELKGIKTQAELARAMNQSSQTVKNWESRGMSKAGLIKAQTDIGCSATWLETGLGSMTLGLRALSDASMESYDSRYENSPFVETPGSLDGARPVREGPGPDSVSVPRVKLRLRAGVASFDTEPDMDGDGHEQMPSAVLTSLRLEPKNLLALRVRGTSMEPMMFEDDVVIIDTSDTKPISRELYALNFDGEACIKQLLHRGGNWYLHSINPDHEPVNVRSGQCSIVGRVVYQPGRVVTGRL
jgi:phage repressor protein C with HTH and peptisase S24 domain